LVLNPLFEKSLIEDTYACRVGKGTHKAIDRCQEYVRKYPWVLQCDIRKYFPSIDHQILYRAIATKVKDQGVLWLIRTILTGGPQTESVIQYFPGDDLLTPLGHPRGIPIGNLTSQFFANFYLNGFDHFVKQVIGIKGYVRYMDDILIFGGSLAELQKVKRDITAYFVTLRLQLHPVKQQIFPTKNGVRFCGFHIFRFYKRIPRSNLISFKHRMRSSIHELSHSQINLPKLGEQIRGWIAHAEHADSYTLRKHLLRHIRVRSANCSSVIKQRVIK